METCSHYLNKNLKWVHGYLAKEIFVFSHIFYMHNFFFNYIFYRHTSKCKISDTCNTHWKSQLKWTTWRIFNSFKKLNEQIIIIWNKYYHSGADNIAITAISKYSWQKLYSFTANYQKKTQNSTILERNEKCQNIVVPSDTDNCYIKTDGSFSGDGAPSILVSRLLSDSVLGRLRQITAH